MFKLSHFKFIIVAFLCGQFDAGFFLGTLIKTANGHVPIEQLQQSDEVVCYDVDTNSCTSKPVVHVIKRHVQSYVQIFIGEDCIFAAPDQKFYMSYEKAWIEAQYLTSSCVLLCNCSDNITIDSICKIDQEQDVYDLVIADHHNFCVSKYNLHVHNLEFVVVEGIAEVIPVIGQILWWSLNAYIFYDMFLDEKGEGFGDGPYETVNAVGHALGLKDDIYNTDDDELGSAKIMTIAQAEEYRKAQEEEERLRMSGGWWSLFSIPGKPSDGDGYYAPKKWDGGKVRAPKSGKYGWPDKKGSVWVPSGPQGHGGEHWDVQHPDGTYDNVYPGGKVRPGKN